MAKIFDDKKNVYLIGADLYDEYNNFINKIEIKVKADNETEAFELFSDELQKIHNGKAIFNGTFKILKNYANN